MGPWARSNEQRTVLSSAARHVHWGLEANPAHMYGDTVLQKTSIQAGKGVGLTKQGQGHFGKPQKDDLTTGTALMLLQCFYFGCALQEVIGSDMNSCETNRSKMLSMTDMWDQKSVGNPKFSAFWHASSKNICAAAATLSKTTTKPAYKTDLWCQKWLQKLGARLMQG